MTEEQATVNLIKLTQEYMKNPPEKRKELYSEYMENRNKIKDALTSFVNLKKQTEANNKIIR